MRLFYFRIAAYRTLLRKPAFRSIIEAFAFMKQPQRPLVSVIIPSYNAARYVKGAVDSALAQTYPSIEIIVVDDGSTDNTKEILAPYAAEKKLIYIRQQNAGLSGARNTGITHAKGEFIALLDADDLFLPKKIEHQIHYLESHPECDISYCNLFHFWDGEENNLLTLNYQYYSGADVLPNLIKRDFIAPLSMVIRRSIFDRFGLFDTNFRRSEDLEFLVRILSQGANICFLDERLAKLRLSRTSNLQGFESQPEVKRTALNLFEDLYRKISPAERERLGLKKHLVRYRLKLGLAHLENENKREAKRYIFSAFRNYPGGIILGALLWIPFALVPEKGLANAVRRRHIARQKNNLAAAEIVLITGGAGFIGSHTVDALAARGYAVRILDDLAPPVHDGHWPKYLQGKGYELVRGDVRKKTDLAAALKDVSYVYHLAAYQDQRPDFGKFFETNTSSAAFLYELILEKKLPVKKIIFASSQFVYGDGEYECLHTGRRFYPEVRTQEAFDAGQFNILCEHGEPARFYPFKEEQPLTPTNAYGLSKEAIERLALRLGKTYKIPSVILRYSIVQGARQSPKNLYSGALRIFSLQALAGEPITVYEDGNQVRDFVNVHDVVAANILALTDPRADYQVFNVGGGKAYRVIDFAKIVKDVTGSKSEIRIEGYRRTDTRNAVSDISKLEKLGWQPHHAPEESVRDYVAWLGDQSR